MLSVVGVTSLPYFCGIFMADFIVALMPNALFTICLFGMNGFLMPASQVCIWTVIFMFFSGAMINLAYLIHHMFDDPETSIKYTGLMTLLTTILIPVILTTIIAAFFKFENGFHQSLYFWFFLDPVLAFVATTFNFCTKSFADGEIQIKMFGGDSINPLFTILALVIQIVLFFSVNVAIDNWLRNRWRKKGGKVG